MLKEQMATYFPGPPDKQLFHYTSFSGLAGIIESKSLWASDARFLNDSKELRLLPGMMRAYIRTLSADQTGEDLEIYTQMDRFIGSLFSHLGSFVFVASLTENGNLLSQWRGYCQHGQGVSIGINPFGIDQSVGTLGRCLYDPQVVSDLSYGLVRFLFETAKQSGPVPDAHPSVRYDAIFEEVRDDLVRLAALMKHDGFKEEEEWRCIATMPRSSFAQASYRPGRQAMIPYIEIPILLRDHITVYVGPSIDPLTSQRSVFEFVSKSLPLEEGAEKHIVLRSEIPFTG